MAPYSREYNRIRAIVEKQSRGDNELRSRYEQIVDQVRQTKESTLQVDERRFRRSGLPGAGVKIIYTWSFPPAHIKISPRAPGRPHPHPQLLSAGPLLSPSFSIPISVRHV